MDEPNDKEVKKNTKGFSVSKVRKVYSNKYDAVKQSLKLARENRRAREVQFAAAAVMGGNTAASRNLSEKDETALINNEKKKFDSLQGFNAIIAISFLSTGFLFAMRKYILKPGEYWRQGNGHGSQGGSNRQHYHYRAHHNHQDQHQNSGYYNSSNQNGSTSASGTLNKDHMTKHHLTILELPISNLRPSRRDVKDAYRKISLRTHPDVVRSGGTSSGKMKKYLEERFILATTAHDELLKGLP